MNKAVRAVHCLLNGHAVAIPVHEALGHRTVLDWLREQRRLTGTKEGCAEGDCGACTIVIGEPADGRLRLRTVNACLQFVPMLDGRAVFTVESLKRKDGALHPVQQALVDEHASQCGFCTPGFAMSLWACYVDSVAHDRYPSRRSLARAISGNLCRCTGYRPILDAGQSMFEHPPTPFDAARILEALADLPTDRTLDLDGPDHRWTAPRTLPELLACRTARPHATLLAGATDVGLWINKDLQSLDDVIDIGRVAGLDRIETTDDGALRIGASAALTATYDAAVVHWPALDELYERFASVPIRNAGTLGGNVANGSPIGDSMPWLIALGAEVVLASTDGERRLPLESLYTGYMQNDIGESEIVRAIEVPLPRDAQVFRTWKLAKRYDSDISAVCGAFRLDLDDDRIVAARVAFGGMAATVRRAPACEAALTGRIWSEATMRAAATALQHDFEPLDDLRASRHYRQRAAANLLARLWLEARPVDALEPEQTSVFRYATL